jgi:hypothetical protein
MKKEYDDYLCKTYPKIFRDRHASMQTTCMCWGFDIGDGWFNIIDKACSIIQGHIDWKRKQRAEALRYNRALKRAIDKGEYDALLKCYSWSRDADERVSDAVECQMYRDVPEVCHQVVATQVKEKFGTLRFYTQGGDEYTYGVISMAESMSACMCEQCGSPAETQGPGWYHTTCQPCVEKRDREREEFYNKPKEES